MDLDAVHENVEFVSRPEDEVHAVAALALADYVVPDVELDLLEGLRDGFLLRRTELGDTQPVLISQPS